MKTKATKDQAKVAMQSDEKEKEHATAMELSKNLNEAVEKSLVKSSSDEARSSPRSRS